MSWMAAVPVTLVCALWLVLPGLFTAYAAGLRGIAAFSLAPLVSVAICSATAIVGQACGLAWSWYVVVGATVLVTAATALGSLLIRRRFTVLDRSDPLSMRVAATIGGLAATGLGWVSAVIGMEHPEQLSQTYDAVYHYSAVAYILDTHRASSLTLEALGSHDGPAFYPGAWHDLASLVAMTTGASIPASMNTLSIAVSIVAWPLACLLLVRQLFGRCAPAMAATALLSISFVAYPWGLMSFGVLWPNLLGLSLVPASLAIVITALGLAKDDCVGRPRAILLLPLVVPTAALAHPNTVFTLAALSFFPVMYTLFRRAVRFHRSGHTLRGPIEVATMLAFSAAVWVWCATAPAFAGVRAQYWAPFATPAQAVGEVLLGATNARTELILVPALVLIGAVMAWRVPKQRWLIFGTVVSGWLYVLAAGVSDSYRQKFSGYWYNDSHRLAAMLPLTMVPLAVGGFVWLVNRIHERLPEATDANRWSAWSRPARSPLGITAGLMVACMLLTGFFYNDVHGSVLNEGYALNSQSFLVDAEKRAFLRKLRDQLPADAVVANNPWSGSGLLWPFADREPLFARMATNWQHDADRKMVAEHLVEAGTNPAVCPAASRLKVKYMLVSSLSFWPGIDRQKDYPGIADPAGRPGFELIAEQGSSKLFRITSCG